MNEKWKYRVSILKAPIAISIVTYSLPTLRNILMECIPDRYHIDLEVVVELYWIPTDKHSWFHSILRFSKWDAHWNKEEWIRHTMGTIDEHRISIKMERYIEHI